MKHYKLKDVTKIYSGATPLTNNQNYYENGNIPWITPKDLSGYKHKYIYFGQRNITKLGLESCPTTIIPKGSVLFSSRAPIGYVAIAGQDLCTNQGFKSFVCDEKHLNNQFLYYYLIKNKSKFESLGNGTTFKEISKKTLEEYQIELPLINEQKSIVKELVILDERYETNCSLISTIEELMNHIYYDIFKNDDSQKSLAYLGDVVDVITGGTPSTKVESYWDNGTYYWYTPSDITSNSSILSYGSQNKITISGLKNSAAKLIPLKSILMTSRATIGEAVINMSEVTTNQGILSLVPKNKKVDVLQLYFWIKNSKKKIISIANGSTFKEVYKKDLEKLQININQNKIKKFTKDTFKLFNLYESLIKENMYIIELKKRIMDVNF